MARNPRSTVIIGKVYKVFFQCDDYLHWANSPDKVLCSTFILALEVNFELALHQHNEGYDTDNIYDLPPMPKRTACIQAVITTNMSSIDPSGSHGGAVSIPPSTLTGEIGGLLFYRSAQKCLNFNDMPPTIMEFDDQDEEEEYFLRASLDDEVWTEKPVPESNLCIHMAAGKSEASYTPQTTANPQ